MSDPFKNLQRELGRAVDRQAAHAESPRRWRRWRRLRRPSRPLAVVLAICVASGSAAAAVVLSGQLSAPLSGTIPKSAWAANALASLAGKRYDLQLYPDLDAGNIGWVVSVRFHGTRQLSDTSGGGFPAKGTPLVGETVIDQGEFVYVLTAPDVAAVRVAHGPTILTTTASRLPFGIRVAIWRSVADITGPAPKLTALNASGYVIPTVHVSDQPQEPAVGWQRPRPPASGSCSLNAAPGSGLSAQWGRVVTAIHGDRAVIGRAFLSCINTEYSFQGSPLEAAVLLDATHSGTPPAMLAEMSPVPGHPDIFNREDVAGGGFTARRIGNAWLVVEGTNGLSQRVRAILALSIGPIKLVP
jgi:hypothetical protein